MDKTKKKYIVLVVVTILVSIIALIGATYALLTMTLEGDKKITLTAGILKVDFTEGNRINLENEAPISDSKGLKKTPYTFTITNTGNINAYYHVSLEEDGNNTLDNSYLKMKLTNNKGYDSGIVKVSDYGNGTFEIKGEETLEPSDTVTYQLWIWLDINADNNAQGKIHQSKIVIESFDRKQQSLVVQQILEDNEVQVEKENMFNYASNGGYFDISSGSPSVNPEYITNGLYSMEDEDGVSYYYRGNVDNNNVQFGEYKEDYYVYEYSGKYFQSLESCQEYSYDSCSESNKVKLASAGDKMYWKLVRVNGDGSLRLIYNGTSTTPDNSDLANSYVVGSNISYNLSYNDPKYTGYTYDNGIDSFIKKEVDTWYSKALGNTEFDSKVIGGRFCSDSSGYKKDTDYGFPSMNYNVFASYDRLGQSATGYTKPNNPTLKCPATTESYGGSYRLKAGLITADELVLAGENPGVTTDSYLKPGEDSQVYYWTMTPAYFNFSYAYVSNEDGALNNDRVNYNNAVRPVINVATNNGFASGDGTASNPYVLS